MVRLELWNGMSGDDEAAFLVELESVVATVPTTAEVWTEAFRLARRARAAGLTVRNADLLIFASARRHGLRLLHRDNHFDQLAKLTARKR